MNTLVRYNTQNIEKFLNDIEKYSIGMDEWFNRFGSLHQTQTNYPPYNVIKESNTEFRLEIALSGFKKNQIRILYNILNDWSILCVNYINIWEINKLCNLE